MNIGPVKQSGNSGKPPAVVGLRMRMRMKMEMKMEMKIFEYWYEPWGRWVGLRWPNRDWRRRLLPAATHASRLSLIGKNDRGRWWSAGKA